MIFTVANGDSRESLDDGKLSDEDLLFQITE